MNSENSSFERYTNINKIEKDLYVWFNEEKNQEAILNVTIIREKALQLNKKYNGDPNFAASNGWLHRWMKKHKITNLESYEQNISKRSYINIEQCSKSNNLSSKIKSYIKIDNIDPCILFIEPFYGGSHKQLIDTLLDEIQIFEKKSYELYMYCFGHALQMHKRTAIVAASLLSEKSSARYEHKYSEFKELQKENNVYDITEDVVLAYINNLSNKFSPNSLWSKWSMVNICLAVREKIDVRRFFLEFKEICDLVTLPSKKWPWRARCSSLTLSQIIPKKTSYKVLFCSSVLNLSELLGLRPDLQILKKIVYFHENQLVYPKKEVKERDFQYGYNQITTCLAADHIIFNSMYNSNSFLWNIDKFIKIMPDCRPQELLLKIQPKTSIISFPINFSKIQKSEKKYNSNTLHIIWPHRWEFDKGPEEFFSVLFRLKSININFKISVLGETFSEIPEIFEKAKNILEKEILNWGYTESKKDYYNILNSGHIVVSTATHEFYGVAMFEAVHCGCYPLVPDRLVYPEIYDKECLYKDENDLFYRLKNYCNNPYAVEKDYRNMTINLKKYDSETIVPEFKKFLLVEMT